MNTHYNFELEQSKIQFKYLHKDLDQATTLTICKNTE